PEGAPRGLHGGRVPAPVAADPVPAVPAALAQAFLERDVDEVAVVGEDGAEGAAAAGRGAAELGGPEADVAGRADGRDAGGGGDEGEEEDQGDGVAASVEGGGGA
ncbi:MAG: hypothetical protein LQ338_007692, partial [Usnochroma carphineum]